MAHSLGDYDEIGDYITKLKQDLAYFEGMVLTGINFRFRADDVLLVIKADRDGKHMVCFTSAVQAIDCLDLFSGHIRSRAYPHINWKEDKYAK